MKIDEYITREVFDQLTLEDQRNLRKYFRLIGHAGNPLFSRLSDYHRFLRLEIHPTLKKDYVLWSSYLNNSTSKSLSLDEVRIMAALGDFHED